MSTLNSKSGRGCLQEVPNIVIWLANFWYFGKLVVEEVATGVSAALQEGKNTETVTEKLKVLSMLMCYTQAVTFLIDILAV